MHRLVVAAFLAALSLAFLSGGERAEAGVMVQIDRGSQTMAVTVDGISRYTWRVSTGRAGFGTPSGVFHPRSMSARWFSRSYDIAQLGGPASHGCVRLHPSAAAVLFGIVSRVGMHNTTIVVR